VNVVQAIAYVKERMAPYEQGRDSDSAFWGYTLALEILQETDPKLTLLERAEGFRKYVPSPEDIASGVELPTSPAARQVIADVLDEVNGLLG